MHVDDTWFNPELNKKLLKELSKRSDWEGFKHFGIYFFFLFLFGFLTYLTWGSLLALPLSSATVRYGLIALLIGMKHYIGQHLKIKY